MDQDLFPEQTEAAAVVPAGQAEFLAGTGVEAFPGVRPESVAAKATGME